jgi:DNA-binding response OmpR family regulator
MAYKVLVVDDEQDAVEVLEKKLAHEGYDVVTAFDGQEALVKMREDNPDIILLDLMLPKKNGMEVLREIRQDYKDRWRPVIIISAKHELDAIRGCYSLEADHYLTKPCTIESILRGVSTMISLIPLRQEHKQ